MNNNKIKLIFSSIAADLLVLKGEELIHVRPDLKDPTINVFVFKPSATFEENKVSVFKELGYIK